MALSSYIPYSGKAYNLGTVMRILQSSCIVFLVPELLKPNDLIVNELTQYLEIEDGALGDVWRRTKAGESPKQIQEARNTAFPNFVWNYNRSVDALLSANLPSSPTMASQALRVFRTALRSPIFSQLTKDYLQAGIWELENITTDSSANQKEASSAISKSLIIERDAKPGIYVYSFHHYLRFPYDQKSSHTLFKVGRSERDSVLRIREQHRTTGFPEEPVLRRVYGNQQVQEDLKMLEKKFHAFLVAADHYQNSGKTAGTEWFLTSLKFLDHIATALNLPILRENDEIYLDEDF
jgi:hypothetical protein